MKKEDETQDSLKIDLDLQELIIVIQELLKDLI